MRIAERTNVPRRIVSDGFAVIPDVFPDTEIATLAKELARSNLPRSKAGVRHVMRHGSVAAFTRDNVFLVLRESS